MQLTVTLGAKVVGLIAGHSAVNGAVMPAGSSVVLVSNDTNVATVDPVPDLAQDTQNLAVPINVLGSGSADITATVTAPDGTPFTAAATLIVAPAVEGLTHITLDLVVPEVNPLG